MSKKLMAGLLLLGLVSLSFAGVVAPAERPDFSPVEGGTVNWQKKQTEPTGWYWMYDGTGGTTGDVVANLGVMPPLPYYLDCSELSGSKLAPYHNAPFKYTMTDSFWYYGAWYEPGDYIYFSPDGWVSFDNSSEDGFPFPPSISPPFPVTDDPNSVIAALWQDNNPLLTADPSDNNRQWYLEPGAQGNAMVFEWHYIIGDGSLETYSYEVILRTGGQDALLERPGCGVVYSWHYIEYAYRGNTTNWNADNGETGFEDYTGTHGIDYQGTITPPAPTPVTTGVYRCWATRAGYKKLFQHDVASIAWLSPGAMVLRYTEIEPLVVVGNVGLEAENFTANLEIFDPDGESVYDHNLPSFYLVPEANDTMTAPCWTPEEIGTLYDKVLTVYLDNDECLDNNTFEATSYVHCDDTFRYMWNFADWTVGWGIGQNYSFMTFYACDDGVLTTGGRVYIYDANPSYAKAAIEVYQPATGCGMTNDANRLGRYTAETHQSGWNKAMFGGFGVFAMADAPGNIFAGVTSSSASNNTGWLAEVGLFLWPGSHPCYLGGGPGRGAYRRNSSYYWGSYTGSYYTMPIELFVHLGFGPFPLSPMPSPPCYYDEAHDITTFRMEQPDQDYVPDGVPLTPELAIANIGRQAEPDAGYFPSIFRAIIVETGEVHYEDTVLIGGSNKIGFLGDPADDPDTMFLAFPPWTPESKCEEDEPWVEYDCYGFIALGEVGPDESDHCPYNDTVYKLVTCLWQHDVGVYDISHEPGFEAEPDIYHPGTAVTLTAHVENYGYNEENDVPVSCEIEDRTADPDTTVYINYQSISFIDWRGNSIGNPYVAEVVFPDWIVPSTNWFVVECRTELVGDMCPLNDIELLNVNSGIAEDVTPVPFALGVVGNSVSYSLPYATRVTLKVYDISGQLVSTLVNGDKAAGSYAISFNTSDVAKGIYLVRIVAGENTAVDKMLIY